MTYQKALRQKGGTLRDRAAEIAGLEKEEMKLVELATTHADIEGFVRRLREVQDDLKSKREEDQRDRARLLTLGEYETAEELAGHFETALSRMARSSREFADVLTSQNHDTTVDELARVLNGRVVDKGGGMHEP